MAAPKTAMTSQFDAQKAQDNSNGQRKKLSAFFSFMEEEFKPESGQMWTIKREGYRSKPNKDKNITSMRAVEKFAECLLFDREEFSKWEQQIKDAVNLSHESKGLKGKKCQVAAYLFNRDQTHKLFDSLYEIANTADSSAENTSNKMEGYFKEYLTATVKSEDLTSEVNKLISNCIKDIKLPEDLVLTDEAKQDCRIM